MNSPPLAAFSTTVFRLSTGDAEARLNKNPVLNPIELAGEWHQIDVDDGAVSPVRYPQDWTVA